MAESWSLHLLPQAFFNFYGVIWVAAYITPAILYYTYPLSLSSFFFGFVSQILCRYQTARHEAGNSWLPHLICSQNRINSRYTAEIPVFLLRSIYFMQQMHMNHFCHIRFYYAANIPNNTYLEEFQGIIFENRHKKTATQPFTSSYNKIHQPSHKTATQPKTKPFQAVLVPSASPM